MLLLVADPPTIPPIQRNFPFCFKILNYFIFFLQLSFTYRLLVRSRERLFRIVLNKRVKGNAPLLVLAVLISLTA